MEYLAIHASRPESNLKSMASLGQVYLRPIIDGKIGKSYENTEFGRMPLVWTGRIPHTITSLPLRGKNETDIHSKARELQDYLISKIATIKEETETALESVKQGSKRQKSLEERLELTSIALNNATQSFTPQFLRESSRGAVYSIVISPMKKSTQKIYLSRFFDIDSNHNSPASTLKRYLRMPYSIVDIDAQGKLRVTENKPSYGMIRDSGIMSIDAETHNWKKIELSKPLKEMKHSDVAIIYLESIGVEQKDMSPDVLEKAMKLSKVELIKRIEKHANENKGEMLTLLTLNSTSFTRLVSLFQDSKKQYSVQDPITGEKILVPMSIVDDSKRIGSESSRIISEEDPIIVTGHNQTGFDYHTIKLLSKNSFPIGVDDSNPKLKYKMPGDFLQIHEIVGRDSIDPAFYFMFHGSTWSNTLDEITRFIHPESVRKSMSHDQLLLNTEDALQGDLTKIEEIVGYGWSDGQKSLHNAVYLLREIYEASLLYRARMIDVSTTSPKALSLDFWIDDLVERGLMPIHNPTFHSLNQLNFSEESRYLFRGMHQENRVFYKNFDRKKMLERVVNRINQGNDKIRGTHEGILISINPYLYSLMHLFDRIPELTRAYDAVPLLEDNHAKARLLNHIENLLEIPLFDILSETRHVFRRREDKINFASESRFKENYGIDTSIKEISDLVHEQYSELFRALRGERILAVKDNNIIVSDQSDIDLDRINALFISEGTVHIGAPREFIFNSDSRISTSGISSPRQNKGLKSEFEKRTLSEFYTALLSQGPGVALEYLHNELRKVRNEGMDYQDQIYEKTASKDFADYSPNARGIIIDAHTQNKALKGEKTTIDMEEEELKKKLSDRFSHPLTMAIGHAPELLKSRKLKKRILTGDLTDKEIKQLLEKI